MHIIKYVAYNYTSFGHKTENHIMCVNMLKHIAVYLVVCINYILTAFKTFFKICYSL